MIGSINLPVAISDVTRTKFIRSTGIPQFASDALRMGDTCTCAPSRPNRLSPLASPGTGTNQVDYATAV